MSLDPNATYAPTEDWRAYSGVLSRRVFAFVIDGTKCAQLVMFSKVFIINLLSFLSFFDFVVYFYSKLLITTSTCIVLFFLRATRNHRNRLYARIALPIANTGF